MYLSKLNLDGTNAGIPTSQTPIDKKKVIPNSRKNTGGKIGGKYNHPKSKLEKFKDEEINENEDVTLDECPHCHSKDLVKLNKAGLDKDNILSKLSSSAVVEHDHNIINYHDDYSFINAESCQHLNRDLEKVKINIPNRTWCVKMKELFNEYGHKMKELIDKNIDHFSEEEFDEFVFKINEYLLPGADEHINDSNIFYADKESALLIRLMEYRDNCI